MSAEHPFTKRQRRQALNSRFGERCTNSWGSGDLPGPYAEGDIVHITADAWRRMSKEARSRLRGQQPGYFIVTYCPSIDEGDAWYVRVWDGETDHGSDRLHIADAGRCTWDHDNDFMAGFTLVETCDPEGLAKREAMLAAGWSLTDEECDLCHGTGRVQRDRNAVAASGSEVS